MIQGCFSHPSNLSGGDAGAGAGAGQTQTQLTQMPQNLITSIYQTRIFNSPTYLTLTWSKSLLSHSLTIQAPDCTTFTISLYPITGFSFFRNRPGSKSIFKTHQLNIKLYWDFTRAEFTHNSAEPDSSFFIAITCNERVEFFLGDESLTTRRPKWVLTSGRVGSESTQLSRREHVFGDRTYVTRPHFMGCKREIGIECAGGVLKVKFDGYTCLVVKRLAWKFRGKERIRVDGVEIEFFWDVYNWVDNGSGNSKNDGHGLFVFQVGDGGVWPEMTAPEKRLLMRKSVSLPAMSPEMSSLSVLQWAEESSSECGRSSCSSFTRSSNSSGGGSGFSLSLYAWRKR